MIRTALIMAASLTLAAAPVAYAKPAPAKPETTKKGPPAPALVERAYAAPDAPIAATATVPPGYTTIYVSGMVPGVAHPEAEKGSIAAFGTTEEQTESVILKLQDALKAQGADLKDVVQMRVYLVGDPAMNGKMDFAGMMKAYSRHFGTADQPNRPVRATVQVAALVAPGFLVEIEVVAVKSAS